MSEQEGLLAPTPAQTVGPYFAVGLTPKGTDNPLGIAVGNEIEGQGEAIELSGWVFDGGGAIVEDALIEIAQADGGGRFDDPGFLGFARSDNAILPDKRYFFRTVKPGPVTPGQAPYISVIVHMRGLLRQAHTRIYFSDEMASNIADPVYTQLPDERRDSLIALRSTELGSVRYRFDIHMQGERETLFFNL